jgi:hypothetical protein
VQHFITAVTYFPFALSPSTPFVLRLSKERTVLRTSLSKGEHSYAFAVFVPPADLTKRLNRLERSTFASGVAVVIALIRRSTESRSSKGE